MAKKTPAKKMTLDKLAGLVVRGFAKHDKRFDKIESKLDATFEAVSKIAEDMTVVKSIVTSNSEHLASIESEIKGMRANELSIDDTAPTLGTAGVKRELRDTTRALA